MSNDFLVNGTSLRTFGKIASFDGVFMRGPLRGANLTVPGVKGDTWQPKIRAAYAFPVPLILQPASEDAMRQLLLDLEALVNSAAAVLTLTRRRVSGLGVTVDQTCQGDFPGSIDPTLSTGLFGRVVLTFVNLSGEWV